MIRDRPQIAGVELVDHFSDKPTRDALTRLLSAELPGNEVGWAEDLQNALVQLIVQSEAERRRLLEAKAKAGEPLSAAEKKELLALMAKRR